MTVAAPTPVPAKGLLDRFIGVITSPKATFEAVVAHPRPVGILFMCALFIALAAALPQFTERGRQAQLDAQVQAVEQWTKQPVTDEAYEGLKRQAAFGGYFAVAGVFIGMPIIMLIFAAVYFVVFNAILGGTATFKQVLAIVTHSQVIAALGAVLGAPVQYMQGAATMAGPFNMGVLVPMLPESSVLVKVLGATSLFTIWGFITTGIGFGVLYRRSARNIAITLIALWFLLVGGGIALFSSFSGS